MSDAYKKSIDALKEFVRVHLILLEYKRAGAQTLSMAKVYSEKSKKLMSQFRTKRRKLKSELNCDCPLRSIVEKRNRETKFLEAETIKIQHKLDELVRLCRNPAIYNANEKWKTRDHSPDTEAVAAAFVAATKSGEACSHQTQFVQDRRLSDSFDFGTSNKAVISSVSEEKSPEKCDDFNKTYTKRSEQVSHIMVDDLRRIVASEIYSTENNWLEILHTDLKLCQIILNNNDIC